MSTPNETYRATMQVQTPEDGPSTLIITRQGFGTDARIWLTLNGAIRTTAVLDDQQVSQLTSRLRVEPGTDERSGNRVTGIGVAKMLRILLGEPSDEELAALTVVLGALTDAAAHEPPPRPCAWRDPVRQLRSPLHPGAGAWRASALPSRKG